MRRVRPPVSLSRVTHAQGVATTVYDKAGWQGDVIFWAKYEPEFNVSNKPAAADSQKGGWPAVVPKGARRGTAAA